MNHHLIPQLKNSTLVVVVCHRYLDCIQYSLRNLFNIIADSPNTWVVLINNAASPDITTYLRSITHSRCIQFELPFNFGKALAANFFFRDHITQENLPQTIVSLDPDTIFSKESFNKMCHASQDLPKAGMIGMRYTKNTCNPERNLFFKPKSFTGISKRIYALSCPFMCTVAGPVFAISADKIYTHCNNELFPKKYIKVYGGDDSALYNALRWRYSAGYLEGCIATHLRSGPHISPELVAYKNKMEQ